MGCRGVLPAALLFAGLIVSACVQTGPMTQDAAQAQPSEAVKPRPTETYLSLGKRLLAAGEPDLAIRAFQGSMNKEGVSAQAITGAGIAYRQQGLLHEARRYFEKASLIAPKSVIAHNNLGVVLYQLKEYYPARDEFRTAFALSNGTSEMAERNLNRAEATIEALTLVPETDQVFSHDVVRLGGGEFRLVDVASPEVDVMAD
jgi:Flp pilus assembly protein TadD